ncbi:adenylyltransferase and sulfurtransferase (MOCS3) [Vairimorpha necatrix]|uniref:Adenylyltransferase and sulfurtransferase (MOCS3) n=1 Tax=Vairimorpha necatrix TaxID=6039 RepID=A0AAX4J957_9MICR
MFHESDLLETERIKYSRQVIVPGVGIDNQIKLRNSSILIVGCGGLGSPLIMYMASCGIGKIGIVDHDKIEIHNLQRQIIYKESDVGHYKVDKAYEFIKNINSNIVLKKYKLKMDYNFKDIREYDILIDCTDNIDTRYVLSDLSREYNKDFICASVIRWEGHLYNLRASGPCYRCLYPNIKKTTVSCDENGIIGPICGIFGSLLGLEVIKTCLKSSDTKLITYNGVSDKYNTFKLRNKNPECPACNGKKQEHKKKEVKKIDDTDFKQIKKIQWTDVLANFDNFFIIDVRNTIHYNMLRIKNSINIPFLDLKNNLNFVNSEKTVLVLCKRGITSLKGAKILQDEGIECFSIEGGIDKYEKLYIK